MNAREIICGFAPLTVTDTLAWADRVVEALAAAGMTICGEQVGWWNPIRGVHPIGDDYRPVHEYECYATDLPVFVQP